MNAQRSVPKGLRDGFEFDLAKASVNVLRSISPFRDGGDATPGGGDIFLGRGESL